MRFIAFFSCLFWTTTILLSQEYISTRQIGGDTTDRLTDMVIDVNSDIYLSGSFFKEVNFAADFTGEDFQSAQGGEDIFITKVDKDFNYLWTKTFGGPGIDHLPRLTSDPTGNLFFSARFGPLFVLNGEVRGTEVDFRHGALVSKLDNAGSFVWVREFKGGSVFINTLGVDPAGNLYVGGIFRDEVDFRIDFDGIPDKKSSVHSESAFLTKISNAGEYEWTKTFPVLSFSGGRSFLFDVVSNAEGDIYITGGFDTSGGIDMGVDFGVADTLWSAGRRDVFVTKIKADGSYGWSRRIGGSRVDSGYRLSLDSDENIYLAGFFQNEVNFSEDFEGASPVVFNTGEISSFYSFVTKLSKDGDYYWSRVLGSHRAETVSFGNDIAVVGDQVIMTGDFSDTLFLSRFFDERQDTVIAEGGQDLYLLRLDLDGNYKDLKRVGGPGGEGRGWIELQGNTLWFAAAFQNEVDFAANFPNSEADIKQSQGRSDVFISKLRLDEINPVRNPEKEIGELKVYPNPFDNQLQVNWHTNSVPQSILSLDIFDARGNAIFQEHSNGEYSIYQQTIQLDRLPSGIYFLRLNFNNGASHFAKFLKQ